MSGLANVIRDRFEALVAEYSQRLEAVWGAAAPEVAREDMQAIIAALEANETTPFVQLIETRAQEQAAAAPGSEVLHQNLAHLEETLLPLVTDVETARWLWRAIAQARALLTRQMLEQAAEQRQTEQALRESENRLKSIVNTVQVGIVIIDPETHIIVDANATAARLIGAPQDQIIGSVCHKFICPAEVGKCPITDLGQSVDNSERLLLTAQGERRPILKTVTSITLKGRRHLLESFVDITERKRAEQELGAARRQLADIIEFLPDPTFMVDAAGRVTAWNHAIEELLGMSAAEMLGKGDYEYALPFYGTRRPILIDLALHPDPQAESKYTTVRRQGDRIIGESYIPDLRGFGERYFIGVATALHDASGQIIGAIESIRDITEHKRAEDELRQRLRELEIINIISQMLVSQTDPHATVETIGDKIRQVFDVQVAYIALLDPPTNTINFPYYFDGERKPTEPLPFGEGMTSRIMQLGQPVVINEDWERRAAEYGAVYPSSQPAQSSVGVPIIVGERVIGVISLQSMERENAFSQADVRLLSTIAANVGVALENARLYALAQQELAERQRAQEQVRLESAALESAANAIVITDKKGQIVWVNPAFTRLTGYTFDEAVNQNPRVLKSGQHDAAFYRNMWETILAGQVWQSEVVNRRKDGSLYTEEMTITPVRDERGEITHFVAIKQDITHRKQLEEQIHQLLTRRGYQVQVSTEIAQEIAAAPALDELFRRVVTLIKERLGYYHAQIFRYEQALNAVVLVTGYGEAGQKMLARSHRLPMGRGVVGVAAATGRSVLASDVTQVPDWRPNPDLPHTQGELAVPIKLRDQVLGILDVQSDVANVLSQDDQLLLEGLCGQIAIAMEDTRLRQEMEERLRELDAMYRAISRQGWESFRQTAQITSAYTFDGITLKAKTIWEPEIERAVKKGTLVPPAFEERRQSPAVTPLSVHGEIIGALGVYDDPRQPMSPEELALVQAVSEQVAQALESARLFEQTQTALSESQALYQASGELNAARAYKDILQALRQYTVLNQGSHNISLNLFDRPWIGEQKPRHIEVKAVWTPQEGASDSDIVMPLAEAASHVLHPYNPTLIQDVATDPRLDDKLRNLYLQRLAAKSVLFAPLVAGGQWIGYISGVFDRPVELSETAERRLMSLIGQAALVIQSARQLEETQRRAQREQILRELTAAINASADLAASLPSIQRQLRRLAPVDVVSLATYTPGDSQVTLLTIHSQAAGAEQLVQTFKGGTRLPLDASGPGWVITHDQPRLDADFRQSQEFAQQFKEGPALQAAGMASRLLLPLRIGGQPIGTLNLVSRQAGAFTDEHIALFQTVADPIALALDRSRLLEETRAALQEVEATHRRYLQEQWQAFTAIEQVLGYVDGPAGLMPATDLAAPPPAGATTISVPIKLRGMPIGVLEFYDENKARTWSEDERALLEALADQAALALENARLFQETQLRAQREHLISQITARVRASMDMETILHTTTEELARALNLSRARIRLGGSQAPAQQEAA